MEPRLITAYALMLLIAIAAALVAGYYYYRSYGRTYARHLRSEARRASEREQKPSD